MKVWGNISSLTISETVGFPMFSGGIKTKPRAVMG